MKFENLIIKGFKSELRETIGHVTSRTVKYLSTNIAGKCFTGDVIGIFTESDVMTTAQMKVHSYKMEGQICVSEA